MIVRSKLVQSVLGGILIVTAVSAGCGGGLAFLNPAFVNSRVGGVVPQTPGPSADFVLVRVVNSTGLSLEFIVTIDRDIVDIDDEGNPIRDEDGNLVTVPARQSVSLLTSETGDAAESGVLFECANSRITRVGLGENLLPTDAAVFANSGGAGGQQGFGVPAGDLNPLELDVGNFNCGDTITFRAITQVGQPGGIGLESFLLPGFEQPSDFTGPSTFVNYQQFLETQIDEGD